MTFTKKMLDKTKDGISYYAMWAGIQSRSQCFESYKLRRSKKTEDLLINLQHHLNEMGHSTQIISNSEITTGVFGESKPTPYVELRWQKKRATHRAHFTAYITSYSRITTMLQLLKIDYEDIRMTNEEMKAMKPELEFGQVPMLELDDGTRLV